MTSSLQLSVEGLAGAGCYYSAHLIPEDVDIRNACKVFRAKVRKHTGDVAYRVFWVRVEGGILVLCSGHPVHSNLLDEYLKSDKLYQGPSWELFEKRVGVALRGYVKNGGRSYGGNRG
jgi:hypothetical protein